MNHLSMDYRFEPKDPSRRVQGLIIVVVLHLFLGYALVSGLARKGLNLIKKPLEAVVIQEVIIPPPPPPPPPKKVEKPLVVPKLDAPPPPYVPPPDVAPQVSSNAPSIDSVATPPMGPIVIAPPPPPAAPVAIGPTRTSIGLACPTQVAPEMPRKALQDGTEGVVKAQIRVKNGVIQDVTVLSGPRVFHAAVKAAMMQYKCVSDGGEVVATQEFNFTVQ
ncbi:MAG: energy transducer TonB [Burkholderiaceae bacterium]|nr:energy transducer TonB [Burkholderiaceae bacterium]